MNVSYFRDVTGRLRLAGIWPYVCAIAICVFLIAKIHAFQDYKTEKTINSDVNYYYIYLPATFIEHDISLQYADTAPPEVKDHIWYVMKDGKRLIKTTIGVAYFLAPGFFIANQLAGSSGYPANGYSLPYKIAVLASAVFFSFLTMILLIRILRRFVNDLSIIITLLILYVGTNLFVYVTSEPGMSHCYSLFLFAAFVELTIRIHEKRTSPNIILLGLTFGIITLVRPSNAVIGIFFLLYNCRSIAEVFQKVKHYATDVKFIALFLLAVILPWLPQIAYWHSLTGELFVFSYHPGERFFFHKPRIIEGLFSFRKGWLLYTPLMIFALVGIIRLRRAYPVLFPAIITFTLVNMYIVFSWWCWWYGGSFSQRALIESYAILCIPLAIVVQDLLKNSQNIGRTAFSIALVGLMYLNQFQAQQYRNATLHWDSMSKAAYFKIFGHIDKPEGVDQLLEPIDYEAALRGEKMILKNAEK